MSDSTFELQLVVTGMHLSPEFGMTVNDIKNHELPIAGYVETLLSSDTPVGITKSVGLGIIGFADAFERLRPDLVVLLGDRFEIFAAAQAAMFANIPIGHIGGGDVTEGAFDESIRHSISKMSHLHFVTNEVAVKRLLRMGEDPERIYNVGSPGLDYLHRVTLPDKNILEKELGVKFREKNFLITFHPVTLDPIPSDSQFEELLRALEEFDSTNLFIFTMPNADTHSRSLIYQVKEFVERNENTKAFISLGQAKYLGLLALSDAVIGNSSSGLYEAPSLGTPTVNIGIRQKGRLKADSVFDCPSQKKDIVDSIKKAIEFGRRKVVNPYQVGDCALLILNAMKKIDDFSKLSLKHFNEAN